MPCLLHAPEQHISKFSLALYVFSSNKLILLIFTGYTRHAATSPQKSARRHTYSQTFLSEQVGIILLTTAQKNWIIISGYEEIPHLLAKSLYKNGEVLNATNDQLEYHPIQNFSE